MNFLLFMLVYVMVLYAFCRIMWPWPKNTYKPNPNLLREAIEDAQTQRQILLLKIKDKENEL